MSARLAILLALCVCAPASRPIESAEPAARAWRVDAARAGAPGDGTTRRPFGTLSEALAAAGPGDRVLLGPGSYPGPVRIERTVSIEGPRDAVLEAADGVVLEIGAPALLAGVTVRGGEVGCRILADAHLESVAFEGQRSAAVRIEDGRALVTGGRVSALPGAAGALGFELSPAGTLVARDTTIEGAFRFAVRGRGGSLRLERMTISGAQVGVGCFEGCQAVVTGSTLVEGSGAGIVVGVARLLARDNLLARYEQCVALNKDAIATLEDNVTALCTYTGISAISARLEARHHLHVGPASIAAIQLVGGEAMIDDAVLLDPGMVGVALRQGRAEVRGALVRGARCDADGIFGDGVFALGTEQLRLIDGFFEDNEGTSVTVQNGTAEMLAIEGRGSGVAGLAAQHRATVTVSGAHLRTRAGPALLAAEGSRIHARFGRLDGGQGSAWAACDQDADILFESAEPARSMCGRSTPSAQ